jgi:hypothetical protein
VEKMKMPATGRPHEQKKIEKLLLKLAKIKPIAAKPVLRSKSLDVPLEAFPEASVPLSRIRFLTWDELAVNHMSNDLRNKGKP